MKMKKKMLFPVILLALALALTACGNDTPDTPELPTIPDTPVPPPTNAPADNEPGGEPEQQADWPRRGVWDGNVYTNEYLGFTFTMPDDWTVEADREGYYGTVHGYAFIDMHASSPITGEIDTEGSSIVFSRATVQIMYQRLEYPFTNLSTAQFNEGLATLMEASERFEVDLISDTTRIGTYDWASLVLTMEAILDVTFYFRHFVSVHEGFAWSIIIEYTEDFGSLDDILAMFSGI